MSETEYCWFCRGPHRPWWVYLLYEEPLNMVAVRASEDIDAWKRNYWGDPRFARVILSGCRGSKVRSQGRAL